MNRYNFLKFLVIVLFLIIIFRLIYLIFFNISYKDTFNSVVNKSVVGESGLRGRIYDRNGVLLVDNIGLKSVYYKNSKNKLEVCKELSDTLDIDYRTNRSMKVSLYMDMYKDIVNDLITSSEIESYYLKKITVSELNNLKRSRITDDMLLSVDDKMSYIYYLMNNGYSTDEKLISRNVSDEVYSKLYDMNLPGVILKLSYDRNYLYGDTLLGIFGSVSKEQIGIPSDYISYYKDKGYSTFDIVGISGLEYQYNDYLSGVKSIYKYNYNDLELVRDKDNGNDLYLTIDIEIQKKLDSILESELIKTKNEPNTEYFNSAFAIVTDPNTFEVLAMSAKVISNGVVYDYTSRIINSSFTVGSVIKGASMSVGYSTGVIDIGTVFYDSCIKLMNTPLKCSWNTHLGYLNDVDALRLSSNSYQFQIAMKVSNNSYYYNMPFSLNNDTFKIYRDMFNSYGLGVKSNIDLPNEYTGIKGSNDTPGLLLDYSIGQYDTYTLLELSRYINTLVSNGNRYNLSLLKEVRNNDNVVFINDKVLINTVNLDTKYIDRIKEGFRNVLLYNGLGYNYIDINKNPAGKTGTSQSFIDSDKDGVIDKETVTSTFVGYFPFDNPKYSIAVITPNVSHVYGGNYTSSINRRISRAITDFLN